MAKQEKIGGFDKWDVNGWLDTLIRAQEILGNKKKIDAVKIAMTDKAEAVDKVEALLNKTDARLRKTFK